MNEIVRWRNNLIDWQKITFDILCEKGELEDSDEEKILDLIRDKYGLLKDKKIEIESPEDVKEFIEQKVEEPKVILKKMYDLKNVNALCKGEFIDFGEESLTVIYGKNATGKSGYSRVLKNACKARDKEKIIPNIYENVFNKDAIAEANFDLIVNGDSTSEKWIENESESKYLSKIAVFDSKCARVFLTEKNTLEYMPYGLDLFTKFATAISNFKESLGGKKELVPFPNSFANFNPEGLVYKFVHNITHLTKESKVDELSSLSQNECEEKITLTQILKSNIDPLKEADKLVSCQVNNVG